MFAGLFIGKSSQKYSKDNQISACTLATALKIVIKYRLASTTRLSLPMRAVPGGFLKENLGLTVHKFNVNVNVVSIAVTLNGNVLVSDVKKGSIQVFQQASNAK